MRGVPGWLQKGLTSRLNGTDEPVTDRQVATHTTASDEKTFNLSISDDPSWPQENISLCSSRQCERSCSVDRPDDLGKLRDSLISFVSR